MCYYEKLWYGGSLEKLRPKLYYRWVGGQKPVKNALRNLWMAPNPLFIPSQPFTLTDIIISFNTENLLDGLNFTCWNEVGASILTLYCMRGLLCARTCRLFFMNHEWIPQISSFKHFIGPIEAIFKKKKKFEKLIYHCHTKEKWKNDEKKSYFFNLDLNFIWFKFSFEAHIIYFS